MPIPAPPYEFVQASRAAVAGMEGDLLCVVSASGFVGSRDRVGDVSGLHSRVLDEENRGQSLNEELHCKCLLLINVELQVYPRSSRRTLVTQ